MFIAETSAPTSHPVTTARTVTMDIASLNVTLPNPILASSTVNCSMFLLDSGLGMCVKQIEMMITVKINNYGLVPT